MASGSRATETAPRGVASPGRVLRQGGAYTAARILNQGITYLLLPLYARRLGTDGLGLAEVLLVVRSVVVVLLSQGLDSAWFRLRYEVNGPAALRRFETSVLAYLGASSVVGLALLALAWPAIARAVAPGVAFAPLGLLTAVAAVALVAGALVERRLQAEQRPLAFAAFSVGRTLVTLVSIVAFVAGLGRGVVGKIEAEAVAAAVVILAALLVLRPRGAVDRAEIRRALAYGVPLVPHALAGLLLDQADRFLIGSLLGLNAVGVYAMGYRLASVGMVAGVAVNQAFAPAFVEGLRAAEAADRAADRGAAARARAGVSSAATAVVLTGCGIAVGVGAVAREALDLVTTAAFAGAVGVVGPVAAGLVPWTWYAVHAQSLSYRADSARCLPLVSLAALAANVGVNLLLLPVLGIAGAALATFGALVVLAAVARVLVPVDLRLPHPERRWLGASAVAVAAVAGHHLADLGVGALSARLALKGAITVAATVLLFVASGQRPGAVLASLRRAPAPLPGEPGAG